MRGKVSSQELQVEQRQSSHRFWGAIQAIPNFGKPGSWFNGGHNPLSRGLAQLAFDLAFGKVKEQNAEH